MASINGRDHLPTDIYSEILSWLPAKEVLRCRIVSKAFDASSRDGTFFLRQSQHAEDDSGLFLRDHDGRFKNMVLTDACSGLPPESLEFLKGRHKRILGSGGGLVLFDVVGDRHRSTGWFYLYNPVRGTVHRIPRPDGARIANVCTVGIALLFADQGDHAGVVDYDYDVVFMAPTPEWSENMVLWVYSSREETWTLVGDSIHVGPRNINFHSHVVSRRGTSIYLASDCGDYVRRHDPYIVAVDINAGTSRILPLPRKAGGYDDIEIAGHGGGLSLIHCNPASELTIWDIKDPERSWVWERRTQVSMASMGLEPARRIRGGFSLINGDTLVFTVWEDVYVYHLKDGGPVRVIRGREGGGCFPYMCSYANTFRPCGRVGLPEGDRRAGGSSDGGGPDAGRAGGAKRRREGGPMRRNADKDFWRGESRRRQR